MRRQLAVVTFAAMLAPVMPAKADDRRECAEQADHDRRIAACSKIIDKASADALAYHNRAEARWRKGDFDGAIADYSKAIELDPDLVRAYDGRARAYTSKGDYIHAVGDATRARELVAKKGSNPKGQPASVAVQSRSKAAASWSLDWRVLCRLARNLHRISGRFDGVGRSR
jgi:tetratricopeptide (TPR) repeat protein